MLKSNTTKSKEYLRNKYSNISGSISCHVRRGDYVHLQGKYNTLVHSDYYKKAIDVLGIESENSAKTAIIKNAISRDFNVVATSTQSTGFAGTKTETEVVTRNDINYLQITLGQLFDTTSGNFDDQTGNFDDGGSSIYNTDGLYDFPTIDLGAMYNSRVTFICKHKTLYLCTFKF